MAIDIFNYNGSLLTTIVDGTVNSSSASINLFGRGYKSWGGPFQQNMIWMMQHFARDSAPSNPVVGQLWYDMGISDNTKIMKVWTGTAWSVVGPLGAEDSENDPVLVASPLNSALEAIRILDVNSVVHNAWRISVAGTILAIFSKDSVYTPDDEGYTANGFQQIYPGITFNSTLAGLGVGVAGDATMFKNNQTNLPNFDNAWSLGSATARFASIFATTGRFTRVVFNNGVGSTITQPSDGNLTITDSTSTTFSSLQFGGTSNLYPALKRNSANLQVRLADDSAFGILESGSVLVNTAITSDKNDTTVASTAWVRSYGGFQGQVVLTSGTGATGTIPAGIRKIKVTVVGAGGAGGGAATAGGAGSGGGSGAVVTRYYTGALGGLSYTYTVGVGGTGVSGGAGNAGGLSSFTLSGTTITANGGSGGLLGGVASTPYSGGSGGTIGVAGDINLIGSSGGLSLGSAAQTTAFGGAGASGFMGMGAGKGAAGASAPTAGAANTGAGGGGNTSSGATTAGSNGGSGLVIVEY